MSLHGTEQQIILVWQYLIIFSHKTNVDQKFPIIFAAQVTN